MTTYRGGFGDYALHRAEPANECHFDRLIVTGFHRMEEELDWLEMADGRKGE